MNAWLHFRETPQHSSYSQLNTFIIKLLIAKPLKISGFFMVQIPICIRDTFYAVQHFQSF
jgi:hypothetical protein